MTQQCAILEIVKNFRFFASLVLGRRALAENATLCGECVRCLTVSIQFLSAYASLLSFRLAELISFASLDHVLFLHF